MLFWGGNWGLPEAVEHQEESEGYVKFSFVRGIKCLMQVEEPKCQRDRSGVRDVLTMSYAVNINTECSKFKAWEKELRGFEWAIIHEMIHIWEHERYIEYALYDIKNAPFDQDSIYWSDCYLESLLLISEFLRPKDSILRRSLLDNMYHHRMEFFTMCTIVSKRIMDNTKLFQEVAPEILKTYSKKRYAFKALVKKLYGYI